MEKISSILNKKISTGNSLLNAKINGFTKIPNLFLERQDITIYEKMVMIIIKKFMMNKTYCWPAIKRIAKDARCSETTTKETIRSLTNKGLVIISKRKGIKSNVYEIKM